MRPHLIAAPANKVLSIESVMQNLRIAHDDDHALLASLIAAVTSYLDGPWGVLRNCLLDQVWAIRGPKWSRIRFGIGNVQSIEEVRYWPADGGAEVLMDPGDYRTDFDAHGAFLMLGDGVNPALAVRADAVTAHFKAGYGAEADSVPEAVKQAMHLLVGHYYKHSEAVITGTRPTELPMGARALLAPYRLQRV